MQYEESSGTCRDSHDPFTHVWPKPVSSSTNPASPAPVVLHNDSFQISVVSGGGPMLRDAVTRYHAVVFAPVRRVSLTSARTAREGVTLEKGGALRDSKAPTGPKGPNARPLSAAATLRITVRDATDSRLPATDQDESYTLALGTDGGGDIKANTTLGALRGLETFAQLVEYSVGGDVQLWHLPISVADRPRFSYRGVKVDTSRHFITLPHLRNVIRAMEAAKLNVLQWHIIDGQSFPLESALFPQLAAKGRYCNECSYSQDDVRALVKYARDRGVRVIPELDIPGHSGFQYGMPEIVACPYFQAGQGSDRALDPTLDATYSFLTDFLSEQATLFGDPVINVYGDEVRFPCWNQSSTIAAWMKGHGIKAGDFQTLTEVFWKRFASQVAPAVRNRTGASVMIGEADVWGTDGPPFEFPAWLRAADTDYPLPLLVEVWGGSTLARSVNGTLRKVLSTEGMKAVIGGPYYLDQDLPHPGLDPALVYKASYWVSVWRTMYSFDPVGDPTLTDEQKENVAGLVTEMWGEQINSGVIEQRIFPHALAVAERGWTEATYFNHTMGDQAFYGQVEGRLNQMSCTLNRRGIQSSPSAPGHCLWSNTV